MYTIPKYFSNPKYEYFQPQLIWLDQESATVLVWIPTLSSHIPCLLMFNFEEDEDDLDFIALGWEDDDDEFLEETDDLLADDDEEEDFFEEEDDDDDDDDDFYDDDDDDDLDDDFDDDLDDDLSLDDDEDEF